MVATQILSSRVSSVSQREHYLSLSDGMYEMLTLDKRLSNLTRNSQLSVGETPLQYYITRLRASFSFTQTFLESGITFLLDQKLGKKDLYQEHQEEVFKVLTSN
jgi:hypothetical protein